MSDTPVEKLTANALNPFSLTGHTVSDIQIETIAGAVEALSKTALDVSDRLPLQADYGDIFAVLESGADAEQTK